MKQLKLSGRIISYYKLLYVNYSNYDSQNATQQNNDEFVATSAAKHHQYQGVEPNLNPNRKPEWTVLFWWTRTEPEPAKFYFSEPEPNLNPQNCAQVNPNRTSTPNKSKNIFFPYPDAADAGTRTIRAVVNFNRINNFFFFFWTKRVTTVKF